MGTASLRLSTNPRSKEFGGRDNWKGNRQGSLSCLISANFTTFLKGCEICGRLSKKSPGLFRQSERSRVNEHGSASFIMFGGNDINSNKIRRKLCKGYKKGRKQFGSFCGGEKRRVNLTATNPFNTMKSVNELFFIPPQGLPFAWSLRC